MVTRTLLLPLAVAVVSLVSVGCAKDVRPKYVEPQLPKNEVVTLIGRTGFFSGTTVAIDGVDGSRTTWGGVSKIKLTPGEHTLDVILTRGNGQYSTSHREAIKFNFEAGHTYELGIKNMLDGRMVLRDKTAKREIIVQR